MKIRTLTGIGIIAVYIAVLTLTVYVHAVFFDIFVLALMLFGAFEMSAALTKGFSPPLNSLIIADIFASYALFKILDAFLPFTGLALVSFFAFLVIFTIVAYVWASKSKTLAKGNGISTGMVMLYPVALLSYMLSLNYMMHPYRQAALLLVFLVPSLSDTFAYLVGSTIKGKKLCPKISPKKTISGAVGGLLGGLAAGGIAIGFSYGGWLNMGFIAASASFNIINFLILGLIGSMFTQAGDILASYIKRLTGIKDFGNYLPGHGGVLDRIDGTMLAALFFSIYMAVLSAL